MQIGFMGVGRMGSGIAGRILSGDHDLIVYDTVRSMAENMQEKGAAVADSIADVCADREVVFSMLPDDESLLAVLTREHRNDLRRLAVAETPDDDGPVIDQPHDSGS